MTAPTVHPLTWPDTMPRSKTREPGAFKTTFDSALKNVETSLRLFGRDSNRPITNSVLSSNVTLLDKRPADPGVAVWFTWDGEQVCIPCDRYTTVASNLQALHHILEAERTKLRHGTLALVKASFRGLRALPTPTPWNEVLGVPATADEVTITQAFRKLARDAHPDKPGGSAARMAELNRARDQGLAQA